MPIREKSKNLRKNVSKKKTKQQHQKSARLDGIITGE
jgi:hypothetical protein